VQIPHLQLHILHQPAHVGDMASIRLHRQINFHLANMDLSGNMTRQVEVDLPVESDASHVANVGRLVEDIYIPPLTSKLANDILRLAEVNLLCGVKA
jgi:hypothetical protein